jgi:hypothetical protein
MQLFLNTFNPVDSQLVTFRSIYLDKDEAFEFQFAQDLIKKGKIKTFNVSHVSALGPLAIRFIQKWIHLCSEEQDQHELYSQDEMVSKMLVLDRHTDLLPILKLHSMNIPGGDYTDVNFLNRLKNIFFSMQDGSDPFITSQILRHLCIHSLTTKIDSANLSSFYIDFMQTYGFHHGINISRLEQCGLLQKDNKSQSSWVSWIQNQIDPSRSSSKLSETCPTLDLTLHPSESMNSIILVLIGGWTKSESDLLLESLQPFQIDKIKVWITTPTEYLDDVIPDPFEDILFNLPTQ